MRPRLRPAIANPSAHATAGVSRWTHRVGVTPHGATHALRQLGPAAGNLRHADDRRRADLAATANGEGANGKRQANEIMGAIRTALHDQPLTLTGHRLVNLRHEFSEARRDPDGETTHGIARFRAVTEPS